LHELNWLYQWLRPIDAIKYMYSSRVRWQRGGRVVDRER